MQLIENLKWRYATKKFDLSKKINEEQLSVLKNAIRLSPSSYGLQLYKVLIISDPETKKQLQSFCWNQSQIGDCSHLFIFCNYKEFKSTDVDEYINLISVEQGIEYKTLEVYGSFIKNKVLEKTLNEQTAWLERQPFLAVSNLLLACAEQHIDTCPMEGFIAEEINKFFQLDNKNLNALLIVAVGYRSEEDKTQYRKKIRKVEDELFEIVGG